jgi:hypothetical protein
MLVTAFKAVITACSFGLNGGHFRHNGNGLLDFLNVLLQLGDAFHVRRARTGRDDFADGENAQAGIKRNDPVNEPRYLSDGQVTGISYFDVPSICASRARYVLIIFSRSWT